MPEPRELLIARNPDPESRLPFLMRLPMTPPVVLRTAGTWPREKALFCYPVAEDEWPAEPEIVEQVAVRSCLRRGAAIDLVLDRGRENRSQIVFTTARGREAVFWQSARTRKQARPDVRTPTARAAGVVATGARELEIVVDAHERYAWKFAGQQVVTAKQALPCGDYGVLGEDGGLVASVERKSLADLVSSLTSGRLKFAMTELASLGRAAVVVEDRYSQVFAQTYVRPAVVADGLAELQVAFPTVPVIFCETRALAEEWTYRFLAAARHWVLSEAAAQVRVDTPTPTPTPTPMQLQPDDDAPLPQPTTAQVRAWARGAGLAVPDRGRLRPEVWAAWRAWRATDRYDPQHDARPRQSGEGPALAGDPARRGRG